MRVLSCFGRFDCFPNRKFSLFLKVVLTSSLKTVKMKAKTPTAVLQLAWFNNQLIIVLCCLCLVAETVQGKQILIQIPAFSVRLV